jgi:hypothetical protein
MKNTKTISLFLLAILLVSGCGGQLTQTIPLETDTYISSNDDANHSELPYLMLSKNSSLEERVIARLPTTNKTADDMFTIYDELYLMPIYILAAIITCGASTLNPSLLTSAQLAFDATSGTPLANQVNLAILAKPWYQTVTWTRAHPFSTAALWANPGGDIDSAYAEIPSTTSGSTIQFNVTDYFRALIQADGKMTHFGFMLRSAGATLSSAVLKSTQETMVSARPRVIATYTGNCTTLGINSGLYKRTYYLGPDSAVITEKLE